MKRFIFLSLVFCFASVGVSHGQVGGPGGNPGGNTGNVPVGHFWHSRMDAGYPSSVQIKHEGPSCSYDSTSVYMDGSVDITFADDEAAAELELNEEIDVTMTVTVTRNDGGIPGPGGILYDKASFFFGVDGFEVISGNLDSVILDTPGSHTRDFKLKVLSGSASVSCGATIFTVASFQGTVKWCPEVRLAATPINFGNCLSCGCNSGPMQQLCPAEESYKDTPYNVVSPSTGGGCSGCSGGAAPGMINAFQLSHSFIPGRVDAHSNMAPGWFTNYDKSIRFFRLCEDGSEESNKFRALVTDPCSGATVEFLNSTGTSTFKVAKGSGYAPFTVLNPLTSAPLTPEDMLNLTDVKFILKRKDGYQYVVYIRNTTPQPNPDVFDCVLTDDIAPTGQTVKFEHQVNGWVAGADNTLQLRISKISDDYGVEAFPVYSVSYNSGRAVWTKVTVKGHDSDTGEFDIDYVYEGIDPHPFFVPALELKSVERSGAELIAHSGGAFDSLNPNNMSVTSEHKLRFGPDRKSTLLYTASYYAGNGNLGNQYEGFVSGRLDASGESISSIAPDASNPGMFTVDYRDRIMTWTPGQSLQYGSEPTFPSVVDPENHMAEIRLAIPPIVCDATGLVFRRTYDPCGNVNRLVHLSDFKDTNGDLVTNPDASYELTLYDDTAGVLPVYYRDRDGYVTKTERDNDGRVLRQITGLLDDDNDTDDHGFVIPSGAQPLQMIYGYVPAGGDGEGHVQWMASGAYTGGPIVTPPANERTDYEYYPSGLLMKVVKPLAVGQSVRSEVVYHWEGSRLVKMTNERGFDTNYLHDNFGRVISTDYPGGSNEQVWYDDANRRMYQKDRNGTVRKTIYDTAWRVQYQYGAYSTASSLLGATNESGMTTLPAHLQQRTRYVYSAGMSRPRWSIQNESARTYMLYDYRGRNYRTTRYPKQGTYRVTEHTYQDNLLFSTRESFPGYTKRTYRGYSADRQTVRVVTTRTSGTTFPDIDAVMNATRHSAGSLGRSREITDVVRDLRGNVVSLIDEYGTETFSEYDEHNHKIREVHGNNATYGSTSLALETIYEYDAEGRMFRTTDPTGVVSESTFDDADNVVAQTMGVGTAQPLATSFTYDVDGSRKTTTSPSGAVTTSYHDDCCGRSHGTRDGLGHGRVVNQDAGGRTVHTATVENYDTSASNLLDPVDALTLSESTTRYYGNGQIRYQTRWADALGAIDPNGSIPIAGIDGVPAAKGVTTQYLYDSRIGNGSGLETGVEAKLLGGNNTVQINIQAALAKLAETPANGGASVTFNAYGGSATVVISPDELTMQVSISDGMGRGVMSALMHGPKAPADDINTLINWSCTQYDKKYTVPGSGFGVSEAVVSIDSDGNTTQTFTNGFGHHVGSMDQLGNITKQRNGPKGEPRYSYNSAGKRTRYAYDALGRQRVKYDPLNHRTRTVFNSIGQVSYRYDAKNKQSLTQYDDLGRVRRVRDRTGKWTYRTYDSAGRLATIKDAENKTTTYGYDILGRRASTTLADGSATAMTYDANGRVIRVDLPSGKSKTSVYRENGTDVSGLLRKVEYRDVANTVTGIDTFTYDAFWRPDGTSSRYGVTTATAYNNRGQLSSESSTYGGQTYTVSHGYDHRGRRNESTYPSGRKVEYTRTVRGEPDLIKWDGSPIENRDYNDLGLLTAVDRPSVDETRTYFDDNQVQTIGNFNVGTAVYAYDDNGNKLSESWDGAMAAHSFTTQKSGAASPEGYDQEDRFMNFVQGGQSNDNTFTRSNIGNISNINFNGSDQARSYSDAHELESIGIKTQVFDADGNLTQIQGLAMLDWDAGGMLKSIITQSPTFDGDLAYGYDASGARSSKTSTIAQGTPVTTVYVYSGLNCVAEYAEGAGPTAPTQEYVYAQDIDSVLMLVRSGGTEKLTVTRNQQWSVTSLVDNTGTVVERYSYDKFGKRTILAGDGSTVRATSSYDMPYGYTSRRHEPETGLMYFRARHYDTSTGEFLSRDPLEYVDGMSLYKGYFAPTNVDPFGLHQARPRTRGGRATGGPPTLRFPIHARSPSWRTWPNAPRPLGGPRTGIDYTRPAPLPSQFGSDGRPRRMLQDGSWPEESAWERLRRELEEDRAQNLLHDPNNPSTSTATDDEKDNSDGFVYHYASCTKYNFTKVIPTGTEVFRDSRIRSNPPTVKEWGELISDTYFRTDGGCPDLCEYKILDLYKVNFAERDPIVTGVPQGFLNYNAKQWFGHYSKVKIINPVKKR